MGKGGGWGEWGGAGRVEEGGKKGLERRGSDEEAVKEGAAAIWGS